MQTGPLVTVGRYEMKEEIASGGMATVYRAIQTGIGGFRTVVAIKILHPHLAAEEEYRRMFLEEARIGALLRHKNLLNVLDYGEEEGVSYNVTEYFPSLSAENLADKIGAIPVAEALYIALQAAEALAALHEARDLEGKRLGLVHRDISPQNILVGFDGRVKVIDFGIARREDPTEKTKPGVVKGKCRYMSPEQAAGKPVSAAADIYALGVVLLRLLSGRKPHGEGGTGEIMARARKGLNARKELARTGLSEEVLAWLEKLLAAEPKDRFATAADAAREARRLLAGIKPGYDEAAFETWMSALAPPGSGKARRRRRKADKAADELKDIARPLPPGEGVHPRWLFMGLAALFLVAMAAHLAERWL